jgi:hypothetical protein
MLILLRLLWTRPQRDANVRFPAQARRYAESSDMLHFGAGDPKGGI